ncbi:MAG: ROK family protein [Chloracidobacterium sp.]|uniref:ROK family protein n=1 Tax=Chloracidobacterium validum TaxID=2821543 RepID=A0ABX8BA62_9BACT|nr:ROK family protein [Chloracidobacterium validum]QUW03302.1 ROK family protein [Chloracidobacterium validum]
MPNTSDERLLIGIECAATFLRGVVCEASGEVVTQRQHGLTGHAPTEAVASVRALVAELLSTESDAALFGGVGIALPGSLNRATDRCESRSLWSAVALDDLRPCGSLGAAQLVSRAAAALIGEYRCGVARGCQTVVYVETGYEVSAAMLHKGRLWTGATGIAGMIGYDSVDVDGEVTLQERIGGDGLIRRAQDRMYRDRTSSLSRRGIPRNREIGLEDLLNMARLGDELAQVMITRAGVHVGMAAARLINLLNPELLLIGGELAAAGQILLDPVREEVERRTASSALAVCRILLSTVDAAVGAAQVAGQAARDAVT